MQDRIPTPPRGTAMLLAIGPSIVWCAEYIGSGEVILATRTGAIFGPAVLWAIVSAIVLKYVIGLAGAHWTVVTGEGMIDLFARLPGPRNWLVWLVLLCQLPAAIVSIGALANASTTFLNSLLPLPGGRLFWGIFVVAFAVSVAWTGRFDLLKAVMSFLVAVIIVGVFYVALATFPPISEFLAGLFGLLPLRVPEWAIPGHPSPWREILPLAGWSAGGFASQVWYSYWVLGAGYGMAAGRSFGQPADPSEVARLSEEQAGRIRGWIRMVTLDASTAVVVGTAVTCAFALAGAGVLRAHRLVPQGQEVAFTLSRIFSSRWGEIGGKLFLLSGCAALLSTNVGQLCGWPRLLADCVRILFPAVGRRVRWQDQFRTFLLFFVVTNLSATLFFDPVKLVQLGSQLDGVLLTPIQALGILAGFLFVLPKMVPSSLYRSLRPSPWVLAGLALSAIVFGIFCVIYLPESLASLLRSP
ncbi:MAG: Nramp family divalent metal transporter [candidate division KSB1 bacterium]|nr:Nramp family divalent metal transporter [candidate division KSB1 bacterium]